jgi:uncharacterized protein YkwD
MPRKLLVATALLVLLVAAIAVTAIRSRDAAADPAIDSEEQAFLTLINNWRAQNGAGPLTFSSVINNAADWMSNDMGVKNYFSHTDSLGRDPWQRMCSFDYCYNTWRGENIAAGYQTAEQVFAAWKASSGHNANMLNPNYKVMGLARVYVQGSRYGWYWTNDFGGYVTPNQPAAPTATPAPTPSPTRTPSPTPSRTPTPAPTPPPGFGCAGDWDCDGWSDSAEAAYGTDNARKCALTFDRNDEPIDSYPVDFNDDRIVNLQDWMLIGQQIGKYSARFDLNRDGSVNVADQLALNQLMFTRC